MDSLICINSYHTEILSYQILICSHALEIIKLFKIPLQQTISPILTDEGLLNLKPLKGLKTIPRLLTLDE